MNVKLSEHVKERMAERGLTREQVEMVFASESWTAVENSRIDPDVIALDAVVDGKKWRFIYNFKTENLVTCYPRR